VDGRHAGWLDLWAGGAPLSADEIGTLADVARVAAALVDLRPDRPR
jgi:hypothetical protein